MACYCFSIAYILISLYFNDYANCVVNINYLSSRGINQVQLFIGSFKLNYSLALDLNNQASYIINTSKALYEQSASTKQITSDIDIRHNNYTLKGTESTDTVYLSQDSHKEIYLSFHVFKEYPFSSKKLTGALAFPSLFCHERYSLLHKLKESNIINYLSFAVFNKKHQLSFGINPSSLPLPHLQAKYHSSLDVNRTQSKWGCSISKVIIRNGTTALSFYTTDNRSSDYAYFDLINDKLQAPLDFMEVLLDKFYSGLIKRGLCMEVERTKRQIGCFHNSFILEGSLTLAIGLYEYSIELKKLWKCLFNYCYLDIIENVLGSHWIIGTSYLNHFDIVFDYEENKMHFYDEKGMIKAKNNSNDRIQIEWLALVSMLTILFVGIGMMIQLKRYFSVKRVN